MSCPVIRLLNNIKYLCHDPLDRKHPIFVIQNRAMDISSCLATIGGFSVCQEGVGATQKTPSLMTQFVHFHAVFGKILGWGHEANPGSPHSESNGI